MTEQRLTKIFHKQAVIHPQALASARRLWGLTDAEALDEIARIFMTGYFHKDDPQSILDSQARGNPETSRRIIVDRFGTISGASVGVPTPEQIERRIARRTVRQRAMVQRKKDEAAAAALALPIVQADFFSIVRAGLRLEKDVPTWARKDYVKFSAWVQTPRYRAEINGYVDRFSDVARMFENMRATRAVLPKAERENCIIEASGQCGVDWVTYHQDIGDVEKVGKINGEFFKGSQTDAVYPNR